MTLALLLPALAALAGAPADAEVRPLEVVVATQDGRTTWTLPYPYVVVGRPLVVGDVDADGREDVLLRIVKSRMCGMSPGDPRVLVLSGRTGKDLFVHTPPTGYFPIFPMFSVAARSTPGGVRVATTWFDTLRVGGPHDLPSMLDHGSSWVTRKNASSIGMPLASAIVGDVDGDGALDVALAYYMAEPNARGAVGVVSSADGSEIWSRRGEAEAELFGRDLASVGDVNRDGCPDVAVSTAPYGRDARVLALSGADGSPIKEVAFAPGSRELHHELDLLGDVDGDGLPELLVAGRIVSLGAERVLDVGPGRPGLEPAKGHFAWAALLGDRIVAAHVDGSDKRTTGFLDGDVWTPLERCPALEEGWTRATSGDFDGDGLPDLLLVENVGYVRSPSCTIRIFPGRDLR